MTNGWSFNLFNSFFSCFDFLFYHLQLYLSFIFVLRFPFNWKHKTFNWPFDRRLSAFEIEWPDFPLGQHTQMRLPPQMRMKENYYCQCQDVTSSKRKKRTISISAFYFIAYWKSKSAHKSRCRCINPLSTNSNSNNTDNDDDDDTNQVRRNQTGFSVRCALRDQANAVCMRHVNMHFRQEILSMNRQRGSLKMVINKNLTWILARFLAAETFFKHKLHSLIYCHANGWNEASYERRRENSFDTYHKSKTNQN